jgi:Mg2+ and Co2+ transporter CorA
MSFKYRKRVFLNPISTGHTSHLLAEVESSRDGEYPWGHYMLTIADCRRRVQLEFFLGTKKGRKQSLTKITNLVTELVQFGAALKKEAEAIETFQQRKKETPKKSKKNG